MDYTLRSLELARELKLVDAQKDIHKQLSNIYSTIGDYRKTYENHLLYKTLYDSIYNVQEIARLAGLELQYEHEKEKQAIELELEQNDNIYLFTDGYVDQIGGPRRKTFRSKYLKDLLLNIHDKDMNEQQSILQKTYNDWKGDVEQIDDILLMGIRV